MIERIIELAQEPARLSVRLDRLVIQRRDHEDVTVPLDELAVLVLAHRQVVLTQSVLSGIAMHGGIVVACNEKSMPVAMMLPLEQHHLQAERFAQQVQAALPVRKRVWQQIVQAKVHAQANLLEELHRDDRGLAALAKLVKSGDTGNIEARAARKYWPAVFADPTFHRDRDADDQNRFLNYGYAVLRATVARAICAAGLHPSFGVHHHNRYDAFCLADDLMEPFRPTVDRAVVQCVFEYGPTAPLDRDTKATIIRGVTARRELDGESRTLFDILARTAASLAQIFAGEQNDLHLPDF